MSLEQVIAENTAAIRELIAKLGNVATSSAVAEQHTPAPVAEKQAEAKKPAAKTAEAARTKATAEEAVAAAPEQKAAPSEQPQESPEVDYKATYAACAEDAKKLASNPAHGRAKLIEVLSNHGLASLSGAPIEKVQAVHADIVAILKG